MGEQSTETKIALLETRMSSVEKFVEAAPEKFVTKGEVETMILQSTPSREDFKADMAEVLAVHGGQEKKDTRNWVLELVKVVVTMVGTGGIATIIVALATAPK